MCYGQYQLARQDSGDSRSEDQNGDEPDRLHRHYKRGVHITGCSDNGDRISAAGARRQICGQRVNASRDDKRLLLLGFVPAATTLCKSQSVFNRKLEAGTVWIIYHHI
jgi:hypothetical protein